MATDVDSVRVILSGDPGKGMRCDGDSGRWVTRKKLRSIRRTILPHRCKPLRPVRCLSFPITFVAVVREKEDIDDLCPGAGVRRWKRYIGKMGQRKHCDMGKRTCERWDGHVSFNFGVERKSRSEPEEPEPIQKIWHFPSLGFRKEWLQNRTI